MKTKMIFPHSLHRYLRSLLGASVLAFAASLESPLHAQQASDAQKGPMQSESMDTTGLNPELASILKQYYRQVFGSPENWDKVDGVRFDGLLHLERGTVRFVAFKKKPDYCKVVIFNASGPLSVLAYDGADAWQLNPTSEGAKPVDMPRQEAVNFIRDASLAGHLMDPNAAGKRIELVGTTKVQDFACYDILVTLPDDQKIRYTLDMNTFYERQRITTNVVNDSQERFVFSDFFRVAGIRFPYSSNMHSNGKLIYSNEMLEIQVNPVLPVRYFKRASGAEIPGGLPVQKNAFNWFNSSEDTIFSNRAFGQQPVGETAFPDFKDIEVPSILDEIGKVK